MYTLIDTEKCSIIHFENYLSALRYRQMVDSGVIYRDDRHLTTAIIETIRATWEKGGQQ